MDPMVVRLRPGVPAKDESGASCYLVFKEGRSYIHAVTIDKVVKTVALPKEESRYFVPLELKGKPYPIARACRRFLAAGRSLGISAKAKAVLNELKEVSS